MQPDSHLTLNITKREGNMRALHYFFLNGEKTVRMSYFDNFQIILCRDIQAEEKRESG